MKENAFIKHVLKGAIAASILFTSGIPIYADNEEGNQPAATDESLSGTNERAGGDTGNADGTGAADPVPSEPSSSPETTPEATASPEAAPEQTPSTEPTQTPAPAETPAQVTDTGETLMYRVYNRNSGEHLYTADKNERNTLYSIGWSYEGIAWIAPGSSKTPVYRLFNPTSGEHLYTDDSNEYNVLPTLGYGWRQEGISFYSSDDTSIPAYRLYNPVNGMHHFTTDANEYNTLPSYNWKQEGIAWYAKRQPVAEDTAGDDLAKGYLVNTWNNGRYFDADGHMEANGWLLMNGTWYHFNADGINDATQTEAPTVISEPGYYISPMKTGNLNSASERIEAMIARGYDYMGTRWIKCRSQQPGAAADCSGLVMQCLLAAGFDPSPATPAHHALPANEYDSRTLYYQTPMRHVSLNEIQRGDILWYAVGGTIIHVAIYLGNGQVIDSWPPAVAVHSINWSGYGRAYLIGAARPFN